jgi:hypothetical protein
MTKKQCANLAKVGTLARTSLAGDRESASEAGSGRQGPPASLGRLYPFRARSMNLFLTVSLCVGLHPVLE